MTAALACMAAWSGGLVFAEVLVPGRPLVGALALAGAGLAGLLSIAVRPAVLGLAVAAGLLGAVRAELPGGDPGQAARAPTLAGIQAVVVGRVADDARALSGGCEFLLEPDSVVTLAGPQPAVGNLMVRTKAVANVPAPGDRIQAVGKLEQPHNRPGFDRRAYLVQRGAYLEMRNAQLSSIHAEEGARRLPGWLRDHYRKAIEQLLPQPHAAVLIGVVLGIRTGIPARLEQDLIATGLVHLLVLSGLKVAVFARLVRAALEPLLGRAATLPALGLIGLYALAGGATPAGVRAAAMGGLAVAAKHLGRPTHVWSSLAATAGAMLAWRPELAWDVGFQLSFVGTAAIVLLTPTVEHRLGWMPGWLREPFAVTCAAQIGTVPFMATNFNVLSPVGPLANAAILPLLPALVAAGLLVAPLAVVPTIGQAVALPLAGVLVYLEQVAGVLARVPAAALTVPDFPAWAGLAYYAALGGGMVAARSRGGTRRLAVVVGLVVPLGLGGVEMVSWGHSEPSAEVLAVGSGQAVLLTGPQGAVLVDGGASPGRLAASLGGHLPPWRHHLEGLMVTGSGLGHVGGLAELDYSASRVVVPEGGFSGSMARKVALAAGARGAVLVSARAGQHLQLAGLDFQILAPAKAAPEPGQLAFRVVGPSGRSFCDLADLDPEDQVAAAVFLHGGCTYLLLPSGGRSAPSPELMAAGAPQRLVVSDAGGQLARDLPRGNLTRTSEDGDVVLPL